MFTPRRTAAALASVLFLGAALPAAPADDTAPRASNAEPAAARSQVTSASTPSPAGETYDKILADYEAASKAFNDAYKAAKDDAGRQKLFNDSYPSAEKYAARFIDFARANPDHAQAADAVVWVATRTYNGEAHEAALKLLAGRYAASDKIGRACQRLAYSQSPAAPDTLRAIIEKNPSRDTKGMATFALGQHLKDRDKTAEAEKLFEEVAAKYGDVPGARRTLGESAKSQLFEIRNLAVGMVAPDIEGEDVDGKRFKLSEYRGKVVVLDFWGDW